MNQSVKNLGTALDIYRSNNDLLKHLVMKTKNTIAAILISLISITAFSTKASTTDHVRLQEEAYIDDIPFNTARIFDSLQKVSLSRPESVLREEAYIDDIPFNTALVVANYHCCEAMKQHFALQPEPYINDIPFNTNKIARQAMSSAYMYASKVTMP